MDWTIFTVTNNELVGVLTPYTLGLVIPAEIPFSDRSFYYFLDFPKELTKTTYVYFWNKARGSKCSLIFHKESLPATIIPNPQLRIKETSSVHTGAFISTNNESHVTFAFRIVLTVTLVRIQSTEDLTVTAESE